MLTSRYKCSVVNKFLNKIHAKLRTILFGALIRLVKIVIVYKVGNIFQHSGVVIFRLLVFALVFV